MPECHSGEAEHNAYWESSVCVFWGGKQQGLGWMLWCPVPCVPRSHLRTAGSWELGSMGQHFLSRHLLARNEGKSSILVRAELVLFGRRGSEGEGHLGDLGQLPQAQQSLMKEIALAFSNCFI